MFLEHLLSHKTGKRIRSTQISSWRREICGDLTSVFRPANAAVSIPVSPLQREQVVTNIQNAKNKPPQLKPKPLTQAEIAGNNFMPQQESGTRKACALPYQLHAECEITKAGTVEVTLGTSKHKFGQKMLAKGAPFSMYTRNLYQGKAGKTWAYAVSANDNLTDHLQLSNFAKGIYDLHISGPNGFYRHFRGDQNEPAVKVNLQYDSKGLLKSKLTGNVTLTIENKSSNAFKLTLTNRYESSDIRTIELAANSKSSTKIDLQKSSGWYDLMLRIDGLPEFQKHYAGHVETGEDSISDPLMGGLL